MRNTKLLINPIRPMRIIFRFNKNTTANESVISHIKNPIKIFNKKRKRRRKAGMLSLMNKICIE